jgi:hypothetical protein
MADSSIPEEVMCAEPDARVEWFRNRVVFHHNMKLVFDDLLRRLRSPKDDLLLFIYGASGTGKTRFCEEFVKEIVRRLREQLLQDLAMIPIVHIELETGSERMSWARVYRALLGALQEILIDNKIKVPLRNIEPKLEVPPGDRPSTEKYYQAVISALVHRYPRAILLDSADLLDMIPTRRKALILKPCLGLCKYTPQVLIGTKELLSLRDLCGPVARRGEILHLRRYFLHNAADQDHFEDALATFETKLPLAKPPDLVKLRDYLYDGCIGCIGILSDWLAEALRVALDEGCTTITKEHLEATHLPDGKLHRLETEAAEGENLLSQSGSGRSQSRQALRQAEETQMQKWRKGSARKERAAAKPRKKGRRRRRPGTPNPARDPIGIDSFPRDIRDDLQV